MSVSNWLGINYVTWNKVLLNPINIGSQYQVVPTEGYLAWEYNPLRNYRLNKNMYEKDGKYYTKEELGITTTQETDYLNKCKELQLELLKSVAEQNSATITSLKEEISEMEEMFKGCVLKEAGELVDFITDELSFSLSHPVDILPQYSYDGSVNLILNDGLNIPRLINSRFTVTGKNTYKIIDRKGDNDTNIYDQGAQFDVDTSLFKSVNKIPKLEYLGTAGGNLSVGNYHFYFKYADADGNESDWVAESGLVSVFIGNSPMSVNTGIRDENSVKSVRFSLSNIDVGYSYVKAYYTRYSADVDGNLVVQAKKIDKNFIITNQGTCSVIVTGDENTTEVTLEEINSSFDSIQNAKTQCSAANRLFMANIHKTRVEYDELSKLSLCFCPYKSEEQYPLQDNGINQEYEILSRSDGYYDSNYIYDKTGYWPGDLYRLGIVYILKDGSLSPVFNIRGATNIPTAFGLTQSGVIRSYYYSIESRLATVTTDEQFKEVLSGIQYSEENYTMVGGSAENENAKGVISLSPKAYTTTTPFPVLGIDIRVDPKVTEYLKNYTKGFFFVRQKRMPLTMCQGMVIGLDKEARTPTLPTMGGVISNINTSNSFIETNNIYGINYVSEGFLGRYYFKLNKKKTKFWKKLLIATAVIVVLAAATVATIFTCGAAAAAIGAGAAAAGSAAAATGVGLAAAATASGVVSVLAGGGALVASTITTVGIVAGSTWGAVVVAGAIEAIYVAARQEADSGKVQAIDGRSDPIPQDYTRGESDSSRNLTQDLNERYIIKDSTKNLYEAVIVPDYQVNQPYYNQFLTGDKFTVRLTPEQPNTNYLNSGYFVSEYRHFYVNGYQTQSDNRSYQVNLVGVPDGCPVKMIKERKYRARAGYPEEAHKYEFIGEAYETTTDKKDNSDFVRGNYGSYVGMFGYTGHAGDQIDIMIPGYQEHQLFDYIQLRAQDTSAFYAISDRIDINEINKKTSILAQASSEEQEYSLVLYRGDCYICQFSHRIIRNFNDPSAPYNDKLVDTKTWRENYDPDATEKYANINLGDVNAIQLGLWLTFQLRSSYNLNIRTIDKSHVDEYLMCGNYRSFYPHYGQLADGNQKIPDSDQYNKGFSKSVSEKYYFEVPDVPYIKQEFQNRIVFSDIHINDAYKNGFRVLRTTNHKDYPMTYGSITKILELKNQLLLVFEHGIGFVTIDNSAEHPSQVLSDLTVISDTYGSQWKDSIIKTPGGVYGVDTVAKKIWRIKNGTMELLSELTVQEFLNQNISLSERELTPILGVRNVKTVYNAFKHDVMFTFYDNLHGLSERSWNLCYNEMLGIFTTFYSWIPSEMVNIDNIPFSFDRDTVKAIGKLGVSDHGNDFSDGVTITNNVLKVSKNNSTYAYTVANKDLKLFYTDPQGNRQKYEFADGAIENITSTQGFIGFLHLDNRTLPEGKVKYDISYKLNRDSQNNQDLFQINETTVNLKSVINTKVENGVSQIKVSWLKLRDQVNVKDLLSEIYYRNNDGKAHADVSSNAKKPTDIPDTNSTYAIYVNKPIFKDKTGKRLMLDEKDQINPDKIVRYLNIKAEIAIYPKVQGANLGAQEAYYNQFVDSEGGQINAGYFESQVAITTDFNLSLLSTDFWKHGQAGIIDIADKVYPTYWYGKQHPFEFECVVVDDPSVHKIFTNLELVSNKVKPESFHYEIVGDVYDFSEDKPTMYFRQEALKALYQYNGYDIEYNPNFLEIEPKQHNKSAFFPQYYYRKDSLHKMYDVYKRMEAPSTFSYDHLAGAEIVYYPTRNEFRVWNHVEAIDVDAKVKDKNGMMVETSIVKANCRYLEDKWNITINPIVVTYKNEVDKQAALANEDSIFKVNDLGVYTYSTWRASQEGGPYQGNKVPPLTIKGIRLEESVRSAIALPGQEPDTEQGKDNSLYGIYDLTDWNNNQWYPVDPQPIGDRREADVRGKFVKIRIRYKGDELAIIDFLNTIYQMSFA